MQIEVRKSEAKVEREYPYVGVSKLTGIQVLFTATNTGIVIKDELDENYEVGHYSDEWGEFDNFTVIAKVKKLIIETE